LRDCLHSIFTLEGEPDFEVIVIDDASSDDT
jgi:glycosyltransferase involved in cell wall biosynthesis